MKRLACDVCIVGAGPAGLVLANALGGAGLSVVVVESGGASPPSAPDPRNEVIQKGDVMRAPSEGRVRALGGTSLVWGGQLIAPAAHDLRDRSYAGFEPWPLSLEELKPYFDRAARLMRLPDEPPASTYPEMEDDQPFVRRIARWPSFPDRNVAQLLSTSLRQTPNVRIETEATCVEITIEAGRATGCRAIRDDRTMLEITAGETVLAAGLFESTRLLLALDRTLDGALSRRHDALGRFLHDHLAASVARIVPRRLGALEREFAYRFVSDKLLSIRYEASSPLQRRLSTGSAFFQVVMESIGRSSFDVVRDTLRRLQREGRFVLPPGEDIRAVAADVPYMLRLGFGRYVSRRFAFPRRANYMLMLNVEQHPHRDNRLSLADERDWTGLPKLVVDWRIRPADEEALRRLGSAAVTFWKARGLERHAGLVPNTDLLERGCGILAAGGVDIFHPVGTTRMGASAADSVLNRDLRTHEIDNLYVLSLSAFPSSGSVNPTFTLLALALRLADRLIARALEIDVTVVGRPSTIPLRPAPSPSPTDAMGSRTASARR